MVRPAYYPISQLPGLSPAEAKQLEACGVLTTLELLRRGSDLEGRRSLSQQLNIHIKYINKWTALANLAQVPAVGCQYCGLLLHCGVCSPRQLAEMSVQQLYPQVRRLQVQLLKQTDLSPSTAQVALWIAQAQQLTRA